MTISEIIKQVMALVAHTSYHRHSDQVEWVLRMFEQRNYIAAYNSLVDLSRSDVTQLGTTCHILAGKLKETINNAVKEANK